MEETRRRIRKFMSNFMSFGAEFREKFTAELDREFSSEIERVEEAFRVGDYGLSEQIMSGLVKKCRRYRKEWECQA